MEEVGHAGQDLHTQGSLEEAELHILVREVLVLEEIRAEALVVLEIQALGLREEVGYWNVEGWVAAVAEEVYSPAVVAMGLWQDQDHEEIQGRVGLRLLLVAV